MLFATNETPGVDQDPGWYKDAVIYQLHVKSFYDGNADGIGDFKGLTEKLDYLQDLGVTAIWLLPFYPSPLKDDGYDISNYELIHPAYGSQSDFKAFLKKAHGRGIRVITELVINHTSDQHPWFQRAQQAPPNSNYRDWYVWSDTPELYTEARIIFQDFESSNWTWDPVAKAYYWHRFYSHQPDLNFDNLQVQKAIFNVLDFWLNQGVDGFRMDAVPYLFEREGTNCENLPETHEFIRKIRAHVDQKYPGRMLLAEANQWPEDAAAYFGAGDEFHMAFHFPLMPRLFMALQMEDRFPIRDILEQTPSIPETAQWAIFLRNHDELTLEMVTDEERDYMVRVYAQDPKMRLNLGIRRRLAPLLGNHRRRMELMNALLFSLPGTPIIYYGDEIAMGDNIHLGDRDGVRTPMQWSSDRNAGFSKVNPQALYLPVNISPEYHFEVINVEVQQQNLHSMLWWVKRIIKLRKRFKAFSRGSLEFLSPENHHILAFIRSYQEENLLVVVNLSRFAQYGELDLSGYAGATPIELFGQTAFPTISAQPYFLSLGPHSFFWFYLSLPDAGSEPPNAAGGFKLPEMTLSGNENSLFSSRNKAGLETMLSTYILNARWFGGKARIFKQATLTEVISIAKSEIPTVIAFVQMDYAKDDSETYVLPVTLTETSEAKDILENTPWAAIGRITFKGKNRTYLFHDGLASSRFCHLLLKMIERHLRIKVGKGSVSGSALPVFSTLNKQLPETMSTKVINSEQSNSSVIFSDRFILKIIRRVSPGINPDFEISEFLTENKFPHTPHLAGSITFHPEKSEPSTLGILHAHVANQGDAWQYTLRHLNSFFENAMAGKERFLHCASMEAKPLECLSDEVPPEVIEMIGPFFESVRLMGMRTAQLHGALASAPKGSPFVPEPFSKLYQRSLFQSVRTLGIKTFDLLHRNLDKLPGQFHEDARILLQNEHNLYDRLMPLLDRKIAAQRIRIHGDYHLGQLMFTGKDFQIIDFEGEPARPVSERRIKRSALQDVAGMLRSFHYASEWALYSIRNTGMGDGGSDTLLQACALRWVDWIRMIFLKAYLTEAREGHFLPQDQGDFILLLDIYLLDKALYELAYELNNRPEWVGIPMKGLLALMITPG
ncbi:MAG: maltose alpha-D-glucosyltransferase [Desulfobacteraceae bacterium]|nr:maltose alpha-D-glucosyltransferase [Desulfobacteraceae bacterium]